MFNGENTALSVIMLIIFPIAAYLIAGVNPAIVLSKLIYKQDIRLLGSKTRGLQTLKGFSAENTPGSSSFWICLNRRRFAPRRR